MKFLQLFLCIAVHLAMNDHYRYEVLFNEKEVDLQTVDRPQFSYENCGPQMALPFHFLMENRKLRYLFLVFFDVNELKRLMESSKKILFYLKETYAISIFKTNLDKKCMFGKETVLLLAVTSPEFNDCFQLVLTKYQRRCKEVYVDIFKKLTAQKGYFQSPECPKTTKQMNKNRINLEIVESKLARKQDFENEKCCTGSCYLFILIAIAATFFSFTVMFHDPYFCIPMGLSILLMPAVAYRSYTHRERIEKKFQHEIQSIQLARNLTFEKAKKEPKHVPHFTDDPIDLQNFKMY